MRLALDIQNLTKQYSNGLEALKGIDLQVEEGDFFALLGANGAGKSTTIGIICSLVNKSQGTVSVFGHDIDTERVRVKNYIGLVPQEFNFSIFEKIEDILVNQAGYYGIPRKQAKERAEVLLKQLELWEKRSEMAKNLSGGMKRRLMIARALMHEPKLLILDEPTAGVDIEIRRSMWDFLQTLNEQGTTIILTTHYLEEAENLCQNISIMQDGEIIENTSMKNLLSQLQTETLVLDVEQSLNALPSDAPFEMRIRDEQRIELDKDKSQTINDVFAFLAQQGIVVNSMRNKSNRLEELFVKLTEGTKEQAQ